MDKFKPNIIISTTSPINFKFIDLFEVFTGMFKPIEIKKIPLTMALDKTRNRFAIFLSSQQNISCLSVLLRRVSTRYLSCALQKTFLCRNMQKFQSF